MSSSPAFASSPQRGPAIAGGEAAHWNRTYTRSTPKTPGSRRTAMKRSYERSLAKARAQALKNHGSDAFSHSKRTAEARSTDRKASRAAFHKELAKFRSIYQAQLKARVQRKGFFAGDWKRTKAMATAHAMKKLGEEAFSASQKVLAERKALRVNSTAAFQKALAESKARFAGQHASELTVEIVSNVVSAQRKTEAKETRARKAKKLARRAPSRVVVGRKKKAKKAAKKTTKRGKKAPKRAASKKRTASKRKTKKVVRKRAAKKSKSKKAA